jgi:RNA polymerase sigma-70 factor (ECF subfamily)
MATAGERGGEGEESAFPPLTRSVELLRRYRAGDRAALDELFGRYAPNLVRLVRVRLGRLAGRVEAEDVVQETLLVAMDKLADFEVRSHYSIMSYLRRIAENQLRNQRKYFAAGKRAAAGETPRNPDSVEPGQLGRGPAAATPSEIVSRVEEEARVDRLLSELEPEEYREVVLLREYEGASWEEIRQELGRPSVGAVQELHRRAVLKLAGKLSR